MLRDEVVKYTELTGEDGSHTPIMKIGAYLDGYEKGLSVLDKVKTELLATAEMHEDGNYYLRDKWVSEIIDKYRTESEDNNGK